jgi:hypothetical protein
MENLMPNAKPLYRTYRPMLDGKPAGRDNPNYILDPIFAKDGARYVRAFLLIQKELQSIFEFVEPSDLCRKAYSFRIHALLVRACIEIEANFKAILRENRYTEPVRRNINMQDYVLIETTHHLSSYEISLPAWDGECSKLKPFANWSDKSARKSPDWYGAYNDSKHDRHAKFQEANLESLLGAVAGLLAVITSQFSRTTFDAGPVVLSLADNHYPASQPAIGDYFRVTYPNDWSDDELYQFDWSGLNNEEQRFAQIDFDVIAS